jgi:Spy/CpxP family protein refolding chaperone
MKNKIMIGVLATSILAGSALAYNGMGKGCNMNDASKMGYKKHAMMNKKGYGKQMKFMRLFYQLNLTKEQESKIRDIVQSSMKKRESMFSAFSANGFDKDKFIKTAMNKKENMIKLKAQTIEEAYNVLTKKQKSQLRVLMDLKEEKGFAFDRYSNGRG